MKKILFLLMMIFSIGWSFAIDYTFYYGNGCPHCAKVEQYMDSVDGFTKLNVTKKEVYYDNGNAKEMMQAASRLGINPTKVGVPFLVIKDGDTEKYLDGDQPIIEYFKGKLGDAGKVESNGIDKRTIGFGILALIGLFIGYVAIKGKKSSQ